MKAIRIHRFGSPEVMCLEDMDMPAPSADQVLIRLEAASVGPWDGWIRAGKSVLPQPLPLTLGSDLTGRVISLGSTVRGLEVGDEVFGVTNKRFTGAYAEYALGNASMIARRPKGVDAVSGAAAPVVAVTALQMLFDHGGLRAGQRVLIHGAAGSVGACAVQLALQAGASVVGTDVGRGLDYVRSLGVKDVVDVRTVRLDPAAEQVDLVIDTVGGDALSRSLPLLRSGGTLVSSVSQPDAAEAVKRKVRASFMLVDVTTRALTEIAERMVKKQLTVRIGAILPLVEARRAHEMLDGTVPRPAGKIVLAIEAATATS
jgi:NADPH:quinone reductase-like Zn-dependent oxidoreductase